MARALLLFWKLNRTRIVDGIGSSLALWNKLEHSPVACLLSPCWSGMRKQLAKHAALKHAANGCKENRKNSLLDHPAKTETGITSSCSCGSHALVGLQYEDTVVNNEVSGLKEETRAQGSVCSIG
jgi:hypothetical protein